MEWKDLGLVEGSDKLFLPDTFRELWLTIAPTTVSATRYTLHIIRDNLNESATEYKRYRTGYAASSTDLAGISVMASQKEAYIEDVTMNGTSYTDSAAMRIFYR